MKAEGRRNDEGTLSVCRLRLRASPVPWCAALLVALVAAVSAQAAQPNLSTVKTKHYLIHSDLDDALLYDLGRRMDAMYDEYSRRLSDFELRADHKALDVYLFRHKRDYAAFTDNKYQNTGGVFVPAQNRLIAYLDGQRDTLRRTLAHEAFHQFSYKAIGANMPVWLNEGMAQLFEEAIWTGETFLMNQVPPRRVRQLQSDVRTNKVLSLKQIMGFTAEKWAANLAGDPAAGSTQYNQAWAMVHYMAYGEDGENGAKLVTMLKALSAGKSGNDAFRESFGNNLEAFRAGFERHALALKPTPEATLIDRHDVLADLFAQLTERGKRFASVYEFRKAAETMKYRLRYTRGQVTWTAEPAQYFRDAGGVAYAADELFFDPRGGGAGGADALPDLVFRHPASRIALRARFHRVGDKVQHEVLVSPGSGAAASAR